ncbi:MAG TPA: hypothetical protein DDW52_30375 [Planctomycetaceae bacterium]|nr:hypothetical protein [Planctomycetaceae bacterium]
MDYKLLALTTPTLVQSENDGPNYNDRLSTGGPGLILAIQIKAQFTGAVTRIKIFTGEKRGRTRISLWEEDQGKPHRELSAGEWDMEFANCWQGPDLSKPVRMKKGETYFIVWEPIAGAQQTTDLPQENFGHNYFAKAPFLDPGWYGPLSSRELHYKYRLFGACEDNPNYQS